MPYIYTVEKKINFRILIILFLILLAIVLGSFFLVYNYIQRKKVDSIYDYMSLSDYGNASFIFTDLYSDYPVDEAVVEAGVDLYYDILVRTTDRDILIDASEKVVIYSKQSLLLYPQSERVWLVYQRLGAAYKNLGTLYYNESYSAYVKAIEMGDKRSSTVIDLAHICYAIGRYDEAIFHLENAIKSEGNDGKDFQMKLYYELADAYQGGKDYIKAIQVLSNLEDMEINDNVLKYNINSKLGDLYLRQGLYNESEFFYRRAMAINEQNPDIYYNIGNLYRTMKKHSDAAYMYRTALEIDKNYVLAIEALRRL